jgi:predicted dehydrogenase
MKTALILFAFLPPVALAQPAPQAPVKVAVIGLVHSHVWGQLSRMLKNDPAQLVGIYDANPELIAEARKAGAADTLFFDNYTRMLDQTKPDFVLAFVENNRHLEIVKACAPRKIHVIFEKPLASTAKDAREIRDIAQKSGIFVMTNYQMAWWSANYTAKKLADTKQLGQVYRLHGVVGHGGPSATGARNSIFFEWLTDPVKNGAGALMDFGCYNALWWLWYMGKPETVYARVDHLQPERFPRVEDNATIVLGSERGSGIFEGSWDLPRSFQDLEIFGRTASVKMVNGAVELRKGRDTQSIPLETLQPERADPLSYMVNAIRTKTAPEGLVGMDINVGVIEIIDAAKESIRSGKAVNLK